MRQPSFFQVVTIAAVVVGTFGCSDTGFQKVTDYGGQYDASITGRVCDPDRNQWMEGATVYTHIISDAGELIGTVESVTDVEGYYHLLELRADLVYTVYVQFGSTVIDQYDVDLTGGGDLIVPDPSCGGSVSGDIAVVTGDFDDMAAVLQDAGIASFTIIDGRDASGLVEFLRVASNLEPYSTVYFAGGHVEEDVFYDSDGSDTSGNVAAVREAVAAYVTAGGKVVASDWSYDVVETIWPLRVDFLGEDTIPEAAQLGVPMNVNASIVDNGLKTAVGESSMQVDFDLDAWPVVERVSDGVTVLQKGDITWQFGMDSTDETARPLSLTFEEGDGAVVYTSWRMASNTDGKGGKAIRYLINDL